MFHQNCFVLQTPFFPYSIKLASSLSSRPRSRLALPWVLHHSRIPSVPGSSGPSDPTSPRVRLVSDARVSPHSGRSRRRSSGSLFSLALPFLSPMFWVQISPMFWVQISPLLWVQVSPMFWVQVPSSVSSSVFLLALALALAADLAVALAVDLAVDLFCSTP